MKETISVGNLHLSYMKETNSVDNLLRLTSIFMLKHLTDQLHCTFCIVSKMSSTYSSQPLHIGVRTYCST
jgi:hypothetical protein